MEGRANSKIPWIHDNRPAGAWRIRDSRIGTLTNFVETGQARDKILFFKFDQVSGTASTSGSVTSTDPKAYLRWIVRPLRPRQRLVTLNARVCHLIRSSSSIRNTPPVGLQQLPWKNIWLLRVQGCEQCPKPEERRCLARTHKITWA